MICDIDIDIDVDGRALHGEFGPRDRARLMTSSLVNRSLPDCRLVRVSCHPAELALPLA